MIRAKGKKNGKTLSVEYNDGEFRFNEKEDLSFEAEMIMLMNQRRPIGGTYFAEKADDPLNIIETIRQYFFDRPVDVETDEDVEMPCEEGVVY